MRSGGLSSARGFHVLLDLGALHWPRVRRTTTGVAETPAMTDRVMSDAVGGGARRHLGDTRGQR